MDGAVCLRYKNSYRGLCALPDQHNLFPVCCFSAVFLLLLRVSGRWTLTWHRTVQLQQLFELKKKRIKKGLLYGTMCRFAQICWICLKIREYALFRNVCRPHQMADAGAEACAGSKQSPLSHQFKAGKHAPLWSLYYHCLNRVVRP